MTGRMEQWKKLRSLALEYLWRWDIYGVGDHRELAPTEYDDWAEELVKVLIIQPNRDAVRRFLAMKIAEDGLGEKSLEDFDVDGLVNDLDCS
ncbi:hypothetical protein [Amycolatopsis sp. GA6-003]|uniref:hypothetical protein n=1 Tax=Amycolatopsis sp. GA6-003 TaxID=2652444 RepID=UPI0039174E8F